MSPVDKAGRGQLDRALPRARDRADVVRGLDLAGVPRARARGDLQAVVAQRRARRAAAAQGELLHQGARGREHVGGDRARSRRRGARVPQHLPPPREQAGVDRLPQGGVERQLPRSSCASTTAGSTTSTARCTFVQQENEFFDLDKADYGLVPVHCDVWSGFIFVNLAAEPSQTLHDFLGPMITALEGYPFDQQTERFFYRATVGSNWKLFMDAFQEFYHAPVLHAKPVAGVGAARSAGGRLRSAALRDRRSAPHGDDDRRSGLAHAARDAQADGEPDAQRLVRSVGRARPRRRSACRASTPRARKPWGLDSFQIWPNFVILIWERGLVPHVPLLADLVQHARVRGQPLLRPAEERARTARAGDGGRHVQGVRAAGRQHARSDADHAGVARASPRSRSTTRRSSAATCTRWRPTGSTTTGASTRRWPDDRCAPARRILGSRAVRGRRGACPPRAALRAAARELDGRDAGVLRRVLPRAEEAIAYCDKFPLDELPEDARALAAAPLLARDGVVPGGGVAPAERARLRRGLSRPPDRADARDAPITSLRADRWVDIEAGELRSPAVVVVEGERIAAVTRRSCRATRPRSTSATSRCCPASWTWSSTCCWAAPAAGTSAATCRTIPRSAPCAARSTCRTTLLAGFTTARNLGLFVKTGGYLLDVALARAIDNGWIDGPRLVPAGHAITPTGGHLDPTMFQRLGPDIMPLSVEEGIANGVPEVRKAVRYQIKYGARAHQDLRVRRRDVAQRPRGRAAVLRRGARGDRRRSAPGRASRSPRTRTATPGSARASAPASTASSTARSPVTTRSG